MGDFPDFRRNRRDDNFDRGSDGGFDPADGFDDVHVPPSKQSLQEMAHDRGRICKKRGCVVCAPLVEQRRAKKKERREATRAKHHAHGRPCGSQTCEVAACAAARTGASAEAPKPKPATDAAKPSRRVDERHRAGLPCGDEACPIDACVTGFANERKRRHKAGRPCRAITCDNTTCRAAR